jgi:hypothetical protein
LWPFWRIMYLYCWLVGRDLLTTLQGKAVVH